MVVAPQTWYRHHNGAILPWKGAPWIYGTVLDILPKPPPPPPVRWISLHTLFYTMSSPDFAKPRATSVFTATRYSLTALGFATPQLS